ncbi:2-iminoacetate synthase ThiH [Natranaerofaba carboxydovora]|uniref:2-iminoacetate synthase ThiH n=1 Tax=Natranaerofaba carboxydovora TaxID=2742683 RepID=UPI001F13BDB8|nr:2-iminoacetate synthase ThiH [Natranaerofaba carboxydovora]UMZ73177.1 2-iminoacetate synthase [Natranaerofaba carboxydovora]
MSFKDIYSKYKDMELDKILREISKTRVEMALDKEYPDENDYLALLSPAAESYLEPMARKAHELTVRNFGRAIVLYTPLYLSDYCSNKCIYCGFRADNSFDRKKLTYEEVEKEGKAISKTDIRHILILTGESEKHTDLEYLKNCVKILKKYFSSITVEIYPMTTEGYKELVTEGVDGLTIYQETYDEDIYHKVHLKGPKRDYDFRLDAPERGLEAGIRRINIGALFGLSPWRKEAFFTGLHAWYLQNKYTEAEVYISFPRLRPFKGEDLDYIHRVTDKNMVQMMLASRLFLPRVGLNLSTREAPELRENLLPLGVTRMSAGSVTAVGGYSGEDSGVEQFEVADHRSVDEIKSLLLKHRYQPVLKDWEMLS